MIGKVIFTSSGKMVEAILDEMGVWTCPARPDVAETLNAIALVRPYQGPASGPFGVLWLHEAADMLDGWVERDEPETVPGRVY